MGYTKEHTEETRRRIIESAGRAFRKKGYDGVGIDRIMGDAGLTRGGFYLHFKSKKALFEAVVAEDFDFTVQVRKLQDMPPLPDEPRVKLAVAAYLNPDRRDIIGDACTMATLSVDIGRSLPRVRSAYEQGLGNLVAAMAKLAVADGLAPSPNDLRSLISKAVGALVLARGMNDEAAAMYLCEAQTDIEAEIDHWPKMGT